MTTQSTLTRAVVSEQLHEIIAGFDEFVAPVVEKECDQHTAVAFDMLLAQLKVLASELAGGTERG